MPVLQDIPFTLDMAALLKRLHLDPESDAAGEMREVAERVAAAARPKALYTEAFVEEKGAETVTIGSVTFTSRVLRANLEGIGRVFPHVATCGKEMDEVPIAADDFMGQFCRDTVKELALGAALAHLTRHVKERFALVKVAAMHPGSGDEDTWPIQQQRELFSLLGDVDGAIGVRLTDTFLMWPNKSVSGIFYPTEKDWVTCRICHRENCPNRRAEFDPELLVRR